MEHFQGNPILRLFSRFDMILFAFRALGKFHGLSLSMKANEPEKFKECISEAINEVYYRSENELWYKGYYRRAAENAEKMVQIVNIIIYYNNNNYHFFRYIFDVFY